MTQNFNQDFLITTSHMAIAVIKIRFQQLAIKIGQDELLHKILNHWKDSAISDEMALEGLQGAVNQYFAKSKEIASDLKTIDVGDLGFPIKCSKTHLQIEKVKQYLHENRQTVIEDLKNGKLFNGLSNEVSYFPCLYGQSDEVFWGSSSSSMASVLLSIIASLYQIDIPDAVGLRYPFHNKAYDYKSIQYPFSSKAGFTLFGEYQYGAHRYFDSQSLFNSEDCSSLVAKVTSPGSDLYKTMTTSKIKEAYYGAYPEYNFTPITCNGRSRADLALVEHGDLYLSKGHVGLILGKTQDGFFYTLETTRDLETRNWNGAGVQKKDLSSVEELHILRPRDAKEVNISLQQLLALIDNSYNVLCNYSDGDDALVNCYAHVMMQYENQKLIGKINPLSEVFIN